MDPNQPLNPAPTPQEPAPPQVAPAQLTLPALPQAEVPQVSGPLPPAPQPTAITPEQAAMQPTPVVAPIAPEGTMPQPMSASQMSPGSGGKKIIVIIVIIVILLAVIGGAAAFFLMSKSGKGGSTSVANTVNNAVKGFADVMDRSDDTLDLGSLINSQETIKSQDLKAKQDQQVNLSNGTSYMVTSVERNYVGSSSLLKPKADKEFVKVNLVVGNRNKEDKLLIASTMFKAKNATGGLVTAEFVSASEVSDYIRGKEVEPGKQVKGSLIFKVDKDEKLSIATEDKYKRLGSEEIATITSEVTL